MQEKELSIDKKLEIIKIVEKELLLDKSSYVNIIDVSKKTDITDFFIISVANSSIHINLLLHTVKQKMKEFSFLPIRKDGDVGSSNWVIVDYGFAIFHIMTEDIKNFYNIENFWKNELNLEEQN